MTRKLFAVAAVAVVAGLAMPAAVAQSLDEIIAKHIEARGGKAKMDTVKTARASGRMSVGPGMEAPFSIFWKTPTMVRMEFTIQGMTGIQAYDGTTGWSLMPFMGKTEPEKMSDEDMQNIIEIADWEGPLVDWKAKGTPISQTMTIDKIEINPDLAESTFHMPEAKAAAPDPAKK